VKEEKEGILGSVGEVEAFKGGTRDDFSLMIPLGSDLTIDIELSGAMLDIILPTDLFDQ
jgi:hypothetical protein